MLIWRECNLQFKYFHELIWFSSGRSSLFTLQLTMSFSFHRQYRRRATERILCWGKIFIPAHFKDGKFRLSWRSLMETLWLNLGEKRLEEKFLCITSFKSSNCNDSVAIFYGSLEIVVYLKR